MDSTRAGPEAAHALRQTAIDCYDDNLLYVDGEVCRVVDQLDLLGLLDTTVVVLTGDHGEQFLEHGQFGHPPSHLFDEQIHVPLLVRMPGGAANRASVPVELVDLSATLVHLAGAEPLAGSAGSVLPLSGRTTGTESASALSFGAVGGSQKGGWNSAIRTRDHKLIRKPNGELHRVFDLRADAGEQKDLSDDPPPATLPMREELEQRWSNAPAPTSRSAARIDPDVRRQLQALGYLQ